MPIIKNKLFFGVAALYDKRNGFYTNEFNNTRFDDQNSLTGNYYLKFLPTEKWAVTLNVKHNNNRNKGVFPLVYGVEEAINNPYRLSQNAITKVIDNVFNSSLSANYAGRAFNFSSQTSYQSNLRYYNTPIDADFAPIDGITLINNYGDDWNKVKVFTQEFRFSSPASHNGPVTWTAGLYGFHQTNPVKQATRFGEDAIFIDSAIIKNSSAISTTRAKSYGAAAFGQLTYAINDRFSITGGLRYDYEKKKQSILGEYQIDPDPTPVFEYRPDTSATAGFHAVSPKLSASYKVGNKNFLFATYSKGFRAGGLTPISSDPSQPSLYAYDPEYSNNFEAGIKNTLLKNHLLVNVTAFYSTITNAQVPTLVLPDAVTITRNTGKLKSKGVEVETSALFAGFQLDYNLGFTDAEFTDLKVARGRSEINLQGKRQLFTPDVTSMLAAQYSLSVSEEKNIKIIARGEWRYLGTQYFDLANTLVQPSYNTFNSRLELSTNNFSIILWGRNLSGKKFVSYGYDFGAVHLGDPRTYGATVSVRL
jgi:iron complex outermembrane receptor protein